jgi:hypothetical protein
LRKVVAIFYFVFVWIFAFVFLGVIADAWITFTYSSFHCNFLFAVNVKLVVKNNIWQCTNIDVLLRVIHHLICSNKNNHGSVSDLF